jgi:hypothetical protein
LQELGNTLQKYDPPPGEHQVARNSERSAETAGEEAQVIPEIVNGDPFPFVDFLRSTGGILFLLPQ